MTYNPIDYNSTFFSVRLSGGQREAKMLDIQAKTLGISQQRATELEDKYNSTLEEGTDANK